MVQPKILKKFPQPPMSMYKSVELWRFKGQHLLAHIGTDNMVQLYFANSDGSRAMPIGLLGWGGKTYDHAVRWMNVNLDN